MALELIAGCPHDISEQDVACQADGLCPLCLAAEVNRLRLALESIRDHWACQYDHPLKQGDMYRGSYGIGVTDGHRLCADIARRALGDPQ
jgi:hypothetical protein